ncbi:hypothetical protein chiPu_0023752, partial [Chiloscyllium punctatum]|nr:hypothetical protein [Chiloscyllium punctatum]
LQSLPRTVFNKMFQGITANPAVGGQGNKPELYEVRNN